MQKQCHLISGSVLPISQSKWLREECCDIFTDNLGVVKWVIAQMKEKELWGHFRCSCGERSYFTVNCFRCYVGHMNGYSIWILWAISNIIESLYFQTNVTGWQRFDQVGSHCYHIEKKFQFLYFYVQSCQHLHMQNLSCAHTPLHTYICTLRQPISAVT